MFSVLSSRFISNNLINLTRGAKPSHVYLPFVENGEESLSSIHLSKAYSGWSLYTLISYEKSTFRLRHLGKHVVARLSTRDFGQTRGGTSSTSFHDYLLALHGSIESTLTKILIQWSIYLRHCCKLREFDFKNEDCIWEDIRDFLVDFQKSSRMSLHELVLDGIAARKRHSCQNFDDLLIEGDSKIQVRLLKVCRVRFDDISSNILPVIDPETKIVHFDATSFNMECAQKSLIFYLQNAQQS
jgi:hypothetical protein